MSPTAVPSRITIDFRDAAMPSKTWILGVDEAATDRLELIAFEGDAATTDRTTDRAPDRLVAWSMAAMPTSVVPLTVQADCACPEFCERDHANE